MTLELAAMSVVDVVGKVIFFLIACVLVVMGLGLVLSGAFEAARALIGGQLGAFSLLNSVGLIIVSVAIIDLSKFVLEEYVLHSRQLRSLPEARQSLTKFMTIVIIAFALEALVTTFEVGRDKMFHMLLYPAGVMVTAIIALVGLGAFQWLTRAGEAEMREGAGDQLRDEDRDEGTEGALSGLAEGGPQTMPIQPQPPRAGS
jgi:hypothetical protein